MHKRDGSRDQWTRFSRPVTNSISTHVVSEPSAVSSWKSLVVETSGLAYQLGYDKVSDE